MTWEILISEHGLNIVLEVTHKRQTKKFVLNEVFNSVVNDGDDPYETSVSGYAADEAKLCASLTACIDPEKRFWRGRDRPLCYIDFRFDPDNENEWPTDLSAKQIFENHDHLRQTSEYAYL